MKVVMIAAFAAMLGATPAMATGGHCDADMDAIKAAMGKTKLSEADAKIVSDVLAKAMDLDKAGKEEECEKSLHAAMKLVGVKEQHKK